jgi:hypothetical protein
MIGSLEWCAPITRKRRVASGGLLVWECRGDNDIETKCLVVS